MHDDEGRDTCAVHETVRRKGELPPARARRAAQGRLGPFSGTARGARVGALHIIKGSKVTRAAPPAYRAGARAHGVQRCRSRAQRRGTPRRGAGRRASSRGATGAMW